LIVVLFEQIKRWR